MSQLDRLFLLADYEHEMCGHVFKNSMKKSYLRDYVLRLKRPGETAVPDEAASSPIQTDAVPLVPDQAHFYLNNHNHFHHNRHRHVNLNSSSSGSIIKRLYEKRNTAEKSGSASSTNTTVKKRIVLNNCTLILLNTYLLSYKTTCDFEDFSQILKHYDCEANNFSVNSNCKKCQVSLRIKILVECFSTNIVH